MSSMLQLKYRQILCTINYTNVVTKLYLRYVNTNILGLTFDKPTGSVFDILNLTVSRVRRDPRAVNPVQTAREITRHIGPTFVN